MEPSTQNFALRIRIFAVLLLSFKLEFFTCWAQLHKCPLYQMHFQKIIGFRPPLEYLNKLNLIYSPTINNFKDSNHISINDFTSFNQKEYLTDYEEPIIKNIQSSIFNLEPSAICWRLCNEDDDCIAYVHLLDTNECYGFSYLGRTHRYRKIYNDLPLVADAKAIFYEKTCLNVPETCKGRLWILTKIPGTSLVFQGKKIIPTLVTRRECAEKCLFETEFKCLSASFAPSYRNNRESRITDHSKLLQQFITLGRCKLSDKDKMIQPDAFRAAPYDEEYIENQCYEREREHDRCSYELYGNSSFIYADAKYTGLTQKECRALCTQESRFYCQGVSFYYENNFIDSECLLHTEDIISMGPRSLKQRQNSIYFRRVKCLEIQVICKHDEMAIKYTPLDSFVGKMYVNLHSKDCMAEGNGNRSVLLRLPIGNELQENRCGIIRAYEVTKEYQRTFISALIVIQNNANVQTQGDRLIKAGCIMSNSTHVQNTDSRMDVAQSETAPNAIALESSLESPIKSDFLHVDVSSPQFLPKITLQIVELSHQHETHDVRIGEDLELQIVSEYNPNQYEQKLSPLLDFRATSLAAKTLDNQNYILLIDEHGCPTDVTVFPALEHIRTYSKNILRARFRAFKFAGSSSVVNFEVQIHYCGENCPIENCLIPGNFNKKYNGNRNGYRSRRQLPTQDNVTFKVQNPVYISTVMDVISNSTETKLNSSKLGEINVDRPPLNYQLNVRGPDKANGNSFIYSERGVLLISSIDNPLYMDSFCVHQSLLIALIIFWLIFQVALIFSCCYVIQKYKRMLALDEERRKIYESFDYIDARRVHWADQGGYTL